MSLLLKTLKYSFFLVLVGLLLGALMLWSMIHYLDEELPEHRHLQNYDPPRVTRFYANDGQLLQEYAQEHRAFIPVDYIPKELIEAFLSAEDKNFYTHGGIDYLGLIRAAFRNLKYIASSKRPMGASSITQQVAKNFLLTNEVSIKRKVKEAILSWKLEKTFSKNKILELYLNEIYLGAGAYGVAAAALHYFNKPLNKLTLSEMAYLAGLPKAPNNYNLHRFPERAVTRRNWVLERMYANDFITKEEYEEALAEPLVPEKRRFSNTFKAKYFSEEVRQKLVKNYGEETLYQGGLVVRTTLDPTLQEYAEEALRKGLVAYDRRYGWRGALGTISVADDTWATQLKEFQHPVALQPYKLAVVLDVKPEEVIIGFEDGQKGAIAYKDLKWAKRHGRNSQGRPVFGPEPKSPKEVLKVGQVVPVEALKKDNTYALAQIPSVEGAIVVMNPHTGRVLALSGGYNFERNKFNRATQAYRQSGSAFKPFIFLAALEKGFTPVTRILDEPIEIDLGPNMEPWRPNNISKQFYGPVTLRRSLEKSYNVSTVRLAQHVGLDKIVEVATRFGVDDTLKPLWSVVLGADETTLLRLVTGYAQVANGGKKISPIFIDRIQDRRGNTLHKFTMMECLDCENKLPYDNMLPTLEDKREKLIDPRYAYQLTSILSRAMKHGTGRLADVPPYVLAGKTGSTNDYRDTWFIGYTHNLVVGVYVGFDAPKSLGTLETGARVAAPVFKDFMTHALKGTKPVPFPTPSGLVFKKVNPDTGQPAKLGDQDIIVEGLIPDEEGKVEITEAVLGDLPKPEDETIQLENIGDGDQLKDLLSILFPEQQASQDAQTEKDPQPEGIAIEEVIPQKEAEGADIPIALPPVYEDRRDRRRPEPQKKEKASVAVDPWAFG